MAGESESPQPTPSSEVSGSQYFATALNEVRKKHPETEIQIRRILENIDTQGIGNFSIFTPSWDNAPTIPFTRVSVNAAIASLPHRQTEVGEKGRKEIRIVFGGIAIPPDASVFIPWDMVYNDVIGYIPGVVTSGKDAEVYVVGYPSDFGGKATEEWLEAIKAGPAAYGRLYGEFVKNIMAQNPENARIVLHGMSLGSTMAEHAVRALSVEDRKKVQLLLDNPVGNHNPLTTIFKALQIPGGFLAEAGSRMIFDERVRASTLAAQPFLNRLRHELSAKGIDWADSSEQKRMKLKAALIDVWNLIKGSPFDTENVRSFIRQGITDPASFPSRGFFRNLFKEFKNKISLTQKNRSSNFAINSTHFISRYRVDKWARIIETFLSPPTSPNV